MSTEVAEDVDVHVLEGAAHLYGRNDVQPPSLGVPDGPLDAGDRVVVGEREDVKATGCGPVNDLFRWHGAVGSIRMDVEVELHGTA